MAKGERETEADLSPHEVAQSTGESRDWSAVTVLLFLALTFPLMLLAATKTSERFRNEITEWANPNSQPARDFRQYRDWFGPNEYVLVTWPGCTRDTEELDSLREKLRSDERIQSLIGQVTSGRSILRGLTKAGRLDEESAIERLRGSILGDDGLATGLAFDLTETGRMNRAAVFDMLDVILAEEGISPDEVHFAGLGHDLHVLDDEGFRSPFRMVPLIMITALLLTWLFVRDFRLALFINALGTYTGSLSFTLIFFSTINLNAIVWPLPTLLMLLTVSACLHFLGYYRSALGRRDVSVSHAELVRKTVRHARRPVLYCATTTAVGLLSLALSSTRPVRQFGFFGAMSVLIASGVLLLGLPAWLTLFPPRFARSATQTSRHGHQWAGLGRFTRRLRWPIIVTMVGGMLFLGIGIPGIRTGGNLRNFFPQGHRILNDSADIESRIGPLSSLELLLRFDNPRVSHDFDRIRKIEEVCGRITSESDIEATVSAATFAPKWNLETAGIRRMNEGVKLKRLRDLLGDYKLLYENEESDYEVWRVSLRYSGLAEVNVPDVRDRVARIAREVFAPGGNCVLEDESFAVIPTGEFLLFDHVDRQFLTDLTVTYVTAFALISLVVLILLRSLRAMLLASLSNVFPALVVLGTGGWLDQSLDVASLMTASVALGIAVDDTLHFMLWCRERIRAGDSQSAAIEDAMRHCGTAMAQTSIACGVAMFLYAFCGFLPTVRFGILLCSMLFMALVGDLILLPALLAAGGKPAKSNARDATTAS
jgi:predicted RND superfamily exporter protein